ncbi:precorrin-3B synthase [Streptomyces purpurogeneiscleroticus]|uniref:precorrin-3B synthase n=1 Tax=Streptomyces purpurogeneiscleroticus TaxID=68259 RepID=UPI001CC0380C|nr:precorrin-3B synthase [Streptomyces purpurogeneiscleroticus]MBZ4015847.1 precorrin-3B synthase [Streptomyces purpurogeneiscleroticus]
MLAAMPTATNPPPRDEPPIPVRLDACPGTLRLHMADDGALARVRVPGGVLTAAQAAALADAAVRLGDGALHLTSRGNVQLRGLDGDCGAALAGLLDAAGLLPSYRHERVRNIVASPLSGLDGAGHTDVRPWLRALDGLLCASEAATALSGRFLFALDDGRGDVASLGADVTLIASGAAGGGTSGAAGAASGGAAESAASDAAGTVSGGALLYIGGAAGALRVRGDDAPRAALAAAEVFLETAAAVGSRTWRVRDLPDGTEELVRGTARRLEKAGIPCTYAAGASLPTGAVPAPGIVDGPDGHRALSVLAPLGTLTAAQWGLLTDVARTDGADEIRLTPWRGAVVPGLDRAAAEARLRDLAAAGLITDPASPWHGVGACIGRPGCAKSLADVRADAATALGTGGGLPVYWSGCARRCGHPQGEWVDVVATPEGYEVDGYRVPPGGEALRTVVNDARDMNESSHVNGSPDVTATR